MYPWIEKIECKFDAQLLAGFDLLTTAPASKFGAVCGVLADQIEDGAGSYGDDDGAAWTLAQRLRKFHDVLATRTLHPAFFLTQSRGDVRSSYHIQHSILIYRTPDRVGLFVPDVTKDLSRTVRSVTIDAVYYTGGYSWRYATGL